VDPGFRSHHHRRPAARRARRARSGMSAVLRTGQEVAGYRIEEQLASGGMGVVYRATQLSLGRTVALKVLAPHLSTDPEFVERFRQEAALQARLEHPGIVTVYEAGESEEGLFLAMRLVEGTDLKRLIASGDLSPERALRLLEQVAAALDAAHEAGLIHRDVKPQNILVDGGDHAFLADFGLTKSSGSRGVTRTGAYLGSLDYVSPEQVRGDAVTSASDRYALAAVLYECLAHELPFPRETEAALLYAHVSEPPPRISEQRPELPATIDDVLARGLAKDPAGRYPTATQLIRDAQAALELRAPARDAGTSSNGVRSGFGETIVDPGLLRRAPTIAVEPERPRPSRWLVAALAVLCAGAIAGGFLLGHSFTGTASPPDHTAVAGSVSFSYPDAQWDVAAANTTLQNPVFLRGRQKVQGGSLLAGIAPTVDARTLLPSGTKHGRAELVRLGDQDALRYASRNHATYAIPLDRGAFLILCSGKPDALRHCESVATSVVFNGPKPGRIGPDPRYASALTQTLARFDAVRVAERRALAAARSPDARAGHAEVLASAYATAAAQVGSLPAGPHERPLAVRLVRGLGRARDGYVLLGAALRAREHAGYLAAAKKIRTADAQANAALRGLERVGYAVRR
jgi:serine/threonine protein kinase